MIELIIEDYLASLKEKDELDVVFPELLKLDGYLIKNIPKTGERQYGVDLLAEKDGEVYLYVIKQGNLTRGNWDSGKNAVRQSIEEIYDVYLKLMLDSNYEKSCKHIVFVTNGVILDSVRPNWEMYKRDKGTEDINITSILLPDLVKMAKDLGFNESLFNKDKRSELRKCLYYLDEPDYNLGFFENIIDQYFQEISKEKSEKNTKKLFASLNMVCGMVNHNAIEKKRYRISIKFCEYILISMWRYLENESKFEDSDLMIRLNRFIKIYIYSNEKFIDNLMPFSKSRNGLPFYNAIEYRLLCFEILGNLCVYGIFLMTSDVFQYLKPKYSSGDVMNLIVALLNNNYGFYYPVYDNDGIELSLLFYYSILERSSNEVEILLRKYIDHILSNIKINKYPILERQYSTAMEVEFGEIDYAERYTASYLWGVIYEWAILIKKEDIHTQLSNFEFLNNTTIQNWNLKSEEESRFFNKRDIHSQGYADILNDCEVFEVQQIILDSKMIDDFKNFSFIKFSFPSVGLMLSKKHRIPIIPSYWRRHFIK